MQTLNANTKFLLQVSTLMLKAIIWVSASIGRDYHSSGSGLSYSDYLRMR